jgi:hypothetical protein
VPGQLSDPEARGNYWVGADIEPAPTPPIWNGPSGIRRMRRAFMELDTPLTTSSERMDRDLGRTYY